MNSTTTTTSSVFDAIANPILPDRSSSSSSIFLPIVPLKNVKNRNELTINHELLSSTILILYWEKEKFRKKKKNNNKRSHNSYLEHRRGRKDKRKVEPCPLQV
jgi:hypothetical protein